MRAVPVASMSACRPRPSGTRGRIRIRRGLGGAGLFFGLAGCVSYAPVIRSDHYGAPGRMEADRVELGGGGVLGPELGGGAYVGFGLDDEVTLEGGGEYGGGPRAMGWLGLRYSPERAVGRSRGLLLDLEGGLGAGVGGSECDDDGCSEAAADLRRAAGGGYLGAGIGYRIAWFSPWLRTRTQLSVAASVPATSYTSLLAGVAFNILDLAHIYVGTGGVLFANARAQFVGWVPLNAGLSFTFGVRGRRRR